MLLLLRIIMHTNRCVTETYRLFSKISRVYFKFPWVFLEFSRIKKIPELFRVVSTLLKFTLMNLKHFAHCFDPDGYHIVWVEKEDTFSQVGKNNRSRVYWNNAKQMQITLIRLHVFEYSHHRTRKYFAYCQYVKYFLVLWMTSRFYIMGHDHSDDDVQWRH